MFRRQQHPLVDLLRSFDLSRGDADRLARRGTPVQIPAGSTFCTEGERGRQAFLILAGEAKVLAADKVVTLGPGAIVGELATLDRHRTRNATVVAHGDLEVLVYDVRSFLDLAQADTLRPLLVPQRGATV